MRCPRRTLVVALVVHAVEGVEGGGGAGRRRSMLWEKCPKFDFLRAMWRRVHLQEHISQVKEDYVDSALVVKELEPGFHRRAAGGKVYDLARKSLRLES